MQRPKDFKARIIRGGIFLTSRQLLASVFSLVNTLIVARILGPKVYGVVATSVGIFYFLKWTVRLGMHIYVVREPSLTDCQVRQILAFYNTVGILICIALWGISPIFGWWTQSPEVTNALRLLVPALWFNMIAGLSIGILEREMRFAEVGFIDALAQIINYIFSIPLVFLGWGYWGPVVGTFCQYFSLACFASLRVPVVWQFKWSKKELKPALAYGLSYYCSNWIFTFKSLTVPLIISRFGGMEVAGIVTVSIRLVQQLSLLRQILNRMAISVMAKLIDDKEKVCQTISKAMAYQAFLMGFTCATFSSFSVWIIKLAFSEEWIASNQLFPLIAISATVGSLFDLHNATLYAAGLNYQVAIRNAAYVGILWIGSIIFSLLFGIFGYGIAEIISLPSYYFVHRGIVKHFGKLDYENAFLLVVAALPSLIGSIWLNPIVSFSLLLAFYSLIFLLKPGLRKIFLELFRFSMLKTTPDPLDP